MGNLSKIVVTGPESSGKSWLSQKLAEHFDAPWAPEYARIYLEKHGPQYDFELLKKIALVHKQYQQKYLRHAKGLVFLDTDMINFQVWQKLVFGKSHTELEEMLKKENDHLYLLTAPDIPWTADPLRENPEDRELIFEEHKKAIEKEGRHYRIVRGQGQIRFENALAAVQELLEKKHSSM